jgi:predicted transcriptional regulator with HTH domain
MLEYGSIDKQLKEAQEASSNFRRTYLQYLLRLFSYQSYMHTLSRILRKKIGYGAELLTHEWNPSLML